MQKSKYQLEIEDTFIKETCNIAVSAVAGSGKTTTLIFLLEVARGSTVFMAFNKSIVDELKRRVPSSDFIEIATCHSIGCVSLYGYFKRALKVSPNKTWKILEKINDSKWRLPKKKFYSAAFTVSALYDTYRVTLCSSIEELQEEADRMGISYEKKHLSLLTELIAHTTTYNKTPLEIDFVDMIYLPAIYPVPLPTPVNLFIDEAQDLNKAQHAIVDKMRVKGRFIAVGDPKQSIYGFAGAHSKSFDLFLEKENTKLLPLSVCYRCGVDIVRFAQRFNPDIEFYENNSKGIVRQGTALYATEGDMIICRNLRPLIEIFFDLIDRNKRAFIKGKDLGKGLITILNEFSPRDSTNILPLHFKNSLYNLKQQLIEKEVIEPHKHPRYINQLEKFSIILRISLKFKLIGEITRFIDNIFSDNTEEDSITLSTIHKAKGLESDNVFILDKQLIPSKYASTTEQFEQENNLFYVAVTRAKKSLTFITSNTIDNDEYITGDQEERPERERFIRQDNSTNRAVNPTATQTIQPNQPDSNSAEGRSRNLRWY